MNFRILIIDDDKSIHEDFFKVLAPNSQLQNNNIQDYSEKIFESPSRLNVFPNYEIDSVFSAVEAIEAVKNAVKQNHPYTLMFVDIKLGTHTDGVDTIQELRKIDSNIETVICSAYSVYSLEEIVTKISRPDKLLFFKKPFTPVEIKQIAHCLCLKWSAQKRDTSYIENLEVLAHSKSQNLKILIDSAIIINQAIEMREAFISVLERICNNSSFCGGHVFLVNEKGELYSSDIWYFNNVSNTEDLIRSTNKIKPVFPGEDLPGRLLVDKEPIVCTDFSENRLFKRSTDAQKAEIITVVGIPIMLGKRVMGAVELYSQVQQNHDKNLLEVLSETVNLLSRSIERSLTEEELIHSRELALTAAKAKSEFLANMSHEIRTPLNAILGYSQILMRNKNLAEPTKDNYLSVIEKSGNHLLGIINTILDLSKIESGKSSLRIRPFSIKALLNEIKSMFNMKCEQKGVSFHLDISDTVPPYVNGDVNKLRHILINLINNSVKHTEKGSILITCMWAKSTTYFDVTDTGCGIPKEFLSEIFTPFFQVVQPVEREGTGLGLAIVKKEVELMKGSIAVDSTVNKGTTIKFQIPMSKSAEAKEGSGNIPIIQELEDGQEWRIMLMDNDKVNRELLFDLFTLHKFKVYKTNYDEEALVTIRDIKPHALYFNLAFAVYNNSSIIHRIKEICPDIVYIGVTSESQEKILSVSQKIGCQEVLYKPFDINTVLYRLSKHLPLRYKFKKTTDNNEQPIKNVVLDWQEIGKILTMQELDILWEQFSHGDLSAIELSATNIQSKHPALKNFSRQLIAWVKEFNDNEIGLCLEKIEQLKES